MASQHHRHQVSLESRIDFEAKELSESERKQTFSTFMKIIEYCNAYKFSGILHPEREYKRGRLLQLVYEHAISDLGRDSILRYFLSSIAASPGLDVDPDPCTPQGLSCILAFLADKLEKDAIVRRVQELADHLVDGFFHPLKASSAKTPQPTPHLTPFSQRQGEILIGTPQQLSSLRGACLKRDRYRCVISQLFDSAEADSRFKADGPGSKDDEGQPLSTQLFTFLEVAHIIPHALASSDNSSRVLNDAKVYALRILDMFDPGILSWVEAHNIDRSYNALSLSSDFHRYFGAFQIYFEADLERKHTYAIKTTLPPYRSFQPKLPLTRELFTTPDHSIDPPMPRLLAIHRACSLILHLSGAGEYVDKVLRDMEETAVNSDGTTELGTIINFKLQSWIAA